MKTLVYHNSKIFEASDEGEESGMIRITVTDQGGGGTSAVFPLAELMPALIAFDAKYSRNEKEVVAEEEDLESVTIIVNGKEERIDLVCPGQMISYDTVVRISTGDYESPTTPVLSVTWRTKGGAESGILSPGQKVPLTNGMIFNACDTSNA